MKEKMEKLLKELYEVDPDLKTHEKALRTLLKELLKAKPDVEFDEEFKAELRKKVWRKIDEVQGTGVKKSFAWLGYSLAGAAVCVLLLVPVFYLGGGGMESASQVSFEEAKITPVGSNAFGTLSYSGGDLSADSSYAGLGGGGDEYVESETTREGDEEAAAIEPYYDDYYYSYPTYVYAYVGDEFSVDFGTVDVLKRVEDSSLAEQFGSYLSGMNLGVVDLGNFGDFKVSYLDLEPVEGAGYSAYIDFNYGDISISYWDPDEWDYYYWEDWESLTEADMLSDEELIAITDAFMAEYGVSTEGFGEPVVEDWEDYIYYDYYPEYVSVVYPLVINGSEVYSEWGGMIGLSLSVDVRDERVDYLSGLRAQAFESSAYEAAGAEEVMDYALDGGMSGYWDWWGDGEELEVQLGTPELGYVQTWSYSDDYSDYSELLVPAYVFPVMNEVEDYYYDEIIVPLASEMMADFEWEEPILYFEDEVFEEVPILETGGE